MCRFLQHSEVYSTTDTCKDTVDTSLKLPHANDLLSLLYNRVQPKASISTSSQSCITSISSISSDDIRVGYSKEEGLREYGRFDYLITGEPRSVHMYNRLDVSYSMCLLHLCVYISYYTCISKYCATYSLQCIYQYSL